MPRVALVTHVEEFLGAPAVAALRGAGLEVVALGAAQSGPAEVADAAREVILAHGQLDVCVMNSAFPAERAPIGELDEARMRAAYEALVFGPMLLARAVAPHMQARRAGKLIFCTSAALLRGDPQLLGLRRRAGGHERRRAILGTGARAAQRAGQRRGAELHRERDLLPQGAHGRPRRAREDPQERPPRPSGAP